MLQITPYKMLLHLNTIYLKRIPQYELQNYEDIVHGLTKKM